MLKRCTKAKTTVRERLEFLSEGLFNQILGRCEKGVEHYLSQIDN